MAISIVWQDATSGTGSVNRIPSAYESGDYFFLFVNTANQPVTMVSPWVQVGTTQGTGTAGSAGGTSLQVWYREATSSTITVADSGSYTFMLLMNVRGLNTSNPINTSSGTTNSNNPNTPPSITTTVANCLVVWAYGIDRDATDINAIDSIGTPNPSTMSVIYENTTSSGVGGGLGIVAGIASAATTTSGTVTFGTGSTYAILSFAIEPIPEVTNWQESCSISQAQTLSATQVVSFIDSLSISQVSTLSANVVANLLNNTFSISQGSTIDSVGGLLLSESCAISQLSTIDASGLLSINGVGEINQSSTISTNATVQLFEICEINQPSSVVANALLNALGSLSINQDGTVNATYYLTMFGQSSVGQSSSINSTASAIYYGLCAINQASMLEVIYTVIEGNVQVLKVWNGNAWVEGTLKRFDGNDWVLAILKRWNGSSWE